jgi:E1A/CREB-binding protein
MLNVRGCNQLSCASIFAAADMLPNSFISSKHIEKMIKQTCPQLLKRVQEHNFAWIFSQPVDPVELNLPDYFDVVKNPMDLGTVKKKVETGCYSSVRQFVADVHLTFDNAITYNGDGSDVSKVAREMKTLLCREVMKAAPPRGSDKDEGTAAAAASIDDPMAAAPVGTVKKAAQDIAEGGAAKKAKAAPEGEVLASTLQSKGLERKREIGGGAFGNVFCVRHTTEGRDYALKVIDTEKVRKEYGLANNEKIMKEVKTLCELEPHPHIVQYFDVFSSDDKRYLAVRMGFCPGGTLQSVAIDRPGGPLSVRVIRTYLNQLASAFVHLQVQGIIHRDFKLDNIAIDEKGGLRIIDFGLATRAEPADAGSASSSSAVGLSTAALSTLRKPRGNPVYRSPESLKAGITIGFGDDMWALCSLRC